MDWTESRTIRLPAWQRRPRGQGKCRSPWEADRRPWPRPTRGAAERVAISMVGPTRGRRGTWRVFAYSSEQAAGRVPQPPRARTKAPECRVLVRTRRLIRRATDDRTRTTLVSGRFILPDADSEEPGRRRAPSRSHIG